MKITKKNLDLGFDLVSYSQMPSLKGRWLLFVLLGRTDYCWTKSAFTKHFVQWQHFDEYLKEYLVKKTRRVLTDIMHLSLNSQGKRSRKTTCFI